MEAFRHRAEFIRDLNDTFKDSDIREGISQIFGKKYLEVIDHYVDQFAGKVDPGMWDSTTKMINMFRKKIHCSLFRFKAYYILSS